MTSVQRGFLIRAISLITVICGSSYVVSHVFFVEQFDMHLHVAMLFVSSLASSLGGYFLVVRPMGEMVRVDAEIKQKDFVDRFSAVIENMQEGVIIFGAEGVLHTNRTALRVMGVTESQLRRIEPFTPGWKLANENGQDIKFEDWPSNQCLRSGIPINTVIRVERPGGQFTWVRIHASPIFSKRTDEDRRSERLPRVNTVVTTYHDITSEREALQRVDLAMKAVKLGVWDWDLVNGRITWDDTLCEMYGVMQTSFKRGYDAFEEMIVHEDRDRVRRTFELAMHECRDASIEYKIRRSDGAIRVVRSESKGFYSREGKALRHVGVNWDVTEQREQELRVLQASKMSSLGEMSAGIAHEINNPLAIILGKSEAMRSVLQNSTPNMEALGRHVDVIEKTAQRIAKIVKSLRAFSRDGQNDPFEATNVGEVVNEAFALCHTRFLNSGIELSVSQIAEDLKMEARAVEISQVLLNLLNNSFDAVIDKEEKWVRVDVTSDSNFVEFAVTDSGGGIAPEVREKMAQPFFTTKEVGLGTGLGLSIVTGIVQSHGGTISVDTKCPNTRLVVRIPKAQNLARMAAAA